MAEVLVSFTTPTKANNGDLYYARAIGRMRHNGKWEGWLEFELAGADEHVRTDRETEQTTRDDLKYWAQGLSATYLEGALERALHPLVTARERESGQGVDLQTSREERRSG
jgi:hypothetical protein